MKKKCLRKLFSGTVFHLINDPGAYLIQKHQGAALIKEQQLKEGAFNSGNKKLFTKSIK